MLDCKIVTSKLHHFIADFPAPSYISPNNFLSVGSLWEQHRLYSFWCLTWGTKLEAIVFFGLYRWLANWKMWFFSLRRAKWRWQENCVISKTAALLGCSRAAVYPSKAAHKRAGGRWCSREGKKVLCSAVNRWATVVVPGSDRNVLECAGR